MSQSITENIVQYLRDETSLTVVDQIFDPADSRSIIAVRQLSGGAVRKYPDSRADIDIQIYSRATDEPTARDNCRTVFDKLREKEFSVTYPAADKTGSESINFARVDCYQDPSFGGLDGRYYIYFFNVRFTRFGA